MNERDVRFIPGIQNFIPELRAVRNEAMDEGRRRGYRPVTETNIGRMQSLAVLPEEMRICGSGGIGDRGDFRRHGRGFNTNHGGGIGRGMRTPTSPAVGEDLVVIAPHQKMSVLLDPPTSSSRRQQNSFGTHEIHMDDIPDVANHRFYDLDDIKTCSAYIAKKNDQMLAPFRERSRSPTDRDREHRFHSEASRAHGSSRHHSHRPGSRSRERRDRPKDVPREGERHRRDLSLAASQEALADVPPDVPSSDRREVSDYKAADWECWRRGGRPPFERGEEGANARGHFSPPRRMVSPHWGEPSMSRQGNEHFGQMQQDPPHPPSDVSSHFRDESILTLARGVVLGEDQMERARVVFDELMAIIHEPAEQREAVNLKPNVAGSSVDLKPNVARSSDGMNRSSTTSVIPNSAISRSATHPNRFQFGGSENERFGAAMDSATGHPFPATRHLDANVPDDAFAGDAHPASKEKIPPEYEEIFSQIRSLRGREWDVPFPAPFQKYAQMMHVDPAPPFAPPCPRTFPESSRKTPPSGIRVPDRRVCSERPRKPPQSPRQLPPSEFRPRMFPESSREPPPSGIRAPDRRMFPDRGPNAPFEEFFEIGDSGARGPDTRRAQHPKEKLSRRQRMAQKLGMQAGAPMNSGERKSLFRCRICNVLGHSGRECPTRK